MFTNSQNRRLEMSKTARKSCSYDKPDVVHFIDCMEQTELLGGDHNFYKEKKMNGGRYGPGEVRPRGRGRGRGRGDYHLQRDNQYHSSNANDQRYRDDYTYEQRRYESHTPKDLRYKISPKKRRTSGSPQRCWSRNQNYEPKYEHYDSNRPSSPLHRRNHSRSPHLRPSSRTPEKRRRSFSAYHQSDRYDKPSDSKYPRMSDYSNNPDRRHRKRENDRKREQRRYSRSSSRNRRSTSKASAVSYSSVSSSSSQSSSETDTSSSDSSSDSSRQSKDNKKTVQRSFSKEMSEKRSKDRHSFSKRSSSRKRSDRISERKIIDDSESENRTPPHHSKIVNSSFQRRNPWKESKTSCYVWINPRLNMKRPMGKPMDTEKNETESAGKNSEVGSENAIYSKESEKELEGKEFSDREDKNGCQKPFSEDKAIVSVAVENMGKDLYKKLSKETPDNITDSKTILEVKSEKGKLNLEARESLEHTDLMDHCQQKNEEQSAVPECCSGLETTHKNDVQSSIAKNKYKEKKYDSECNNVEQTSKNKEEETLDKQTDGKCDSKLNTPEQASLKGIPLPNKQTENSINDSKHQTASNSDKRSKPDIDEFSRFVKTMQECVPQSEFVASVFGTFNKFIESKKQKEKGKENSNSAKTALNDNSVNESVEQNCEPNLDISAAVKDSSNEIDRKKESISIKEKEQTANQQQVDEQSDQDFTWNGEENVVKNNIGISKNTDKKNMNGEANSENSDSGRKEMPSVRSDNLWKKTNVQFIPLGAKHTPNKSVRKETVKDERQKHESGIHSSILKEAKGTSPSKLKSLKKSSLARKLPYVKSSSNSQKRGDKNPETDAVKSNKGDNPPAVNVNLGHLQKSTDSNKMKINRSVADLKHSSKVKDVRDVTKSEVDSLENSEVTTSNPISTKSMIPLKSDSNIEANDKKSDAENVVKDINTNESLQEGNINVATHANLPACLPLYQPKKQRTMSGCGPSVLENSTLKAKDEAEQSKANKSEAKWKCQGINIFESFSKAVNSLPLTRNEKLLKVKSDSQELEKGAEGETVQSSKHQYGESQSLEKEKLSNTNFSELEKTGHEEHKSVSSMSEESCKVRDEVAEKQSSKCISSEINDDKVSVAKESDMCIKTGCKEDNKIQNDPSQLTETNFEAEENVKSSTDVVKCNKTIEDEVNDCKTLEGNSSEHAEIIDEGETKLGCNSDPNETSDTSKNGHCEYGQLPEVKALQQSNATLGQCFELPADQMDKDNTSAERNEEACGSTSDADSMDKEDIDDDDIELIHLNLDTPASPEDHTGIQGNDHTSSKEKQSSPEGHIDKQGADHRSLMEEQSLEQTVDSVEQTVDGKKEFECPLSPEYMPMTPAPPALRQMAPHVPLIHKVFVQGTIQKKDLEPGNQVKQIDHNEQLNSPLQEQIESFINGISEGGDLKSPKHSNHNCTNLTGRSKYCDDELFYNDKENKEKSGCQSYTGTPGKRKPVERTPHKRFGIRLENASRQLEDDEAESTSEKELDKSNIQNNKGASQKLSDDSPKEVQDNTEDEPIVTTGSIVDNEPNQNCLSWIEKARKNVRTPKKPKTAVAVDTYSNNDQGSTAPDSDVNTDVDQPTQTEAEKTSTAIDHMDVPHQSLSSVPPIPDKDLLNSSIYFKGFEVCHTKVLKSNLNVINSAHLNPKKLYCESGRCLLCLTCSTYFTPLAFTVHHDEKSVLKDMDQERCKDSGFKPKDSGIEFWNQSAGAIFDDFQKYFAAEKSKKKIPGLQPKPPAGLETLIERTEKSKQKKEENNNVIISTDSETKSCSDNAEAEKSPQDNSTERVALSEPENVREKQNAPKGNDRTRAKSAEGQPPYIDSISDDEMPVLVKERCDRESERQDIRQLRKGRSNSGPSQVKLDEKLQAVRSLQLQQDIAEMNRGGGRAPNVTVLPQYQQQQPQMHGQSCGPQTFHQQNQLPVNRGLHHHPDFQQMNSSNQQGFVQASTSTSFTQGGNNSYGHNPQAFRSGQCQPNLSQPGMPHQPSMPTHIPTGPTPYRQPEQRPVPLSHPFVTSQNFGQTLASPTMTSAGFIENPEQAQMYSSLTAPLLDQSRGSRPGMQQPNFPDQQRHRNYSGTSQTMGVPGPVPSFPGPCAGPSSGFQDRSMCPEIRPTMQGPVHTGQLRSNDREPMKDGFATSGSQPGLNQQSPGTSPNPPTYRNGAQNGPAHGDGQQRFGNPRFESQLNTLLTNMATDVFGITCMDDGMKLMLMSDLIKLRGYRLMGQALKDQLDMRRQNR